MIGSLQLVVIVELASARYQGLASGTGVVPNDCVHPIIHQRLPPLLPSTKIDASLFFANFRQLADIYRYSAQLASTYPNLAQDFKMGMSWEGRDIRALRITASGASTPSARYPGYSFE